MTDTGGVEGLFGELLDDVALAAPVSRARLADALACIDAYGPPETTSTRTRDGLAVHTLTVEEWESIAAGCSLTPAAQLAAREAHRRLATALGAASDGSGVDPLVRRAG